VEVEAKDARLIPSVCHAIVENDFQHQFRRERRVAGSTQTGVTAGTLACPFPEPRKETPA
jgi:hypothetical protein